MGGQYDTRFVEERFALPGNPGERGQFHPEIAAVFATLVAHESFQRSAEFVLRNERDTSNWKWMGRWERMHR